MKKYGKLFIVFLLVLSLIVSIIPNISFADSGTDYPGNDSGFDFKIDPPESTIIYFDKDGNKIHDTNSIYWIEFTLSDDGKYLSFEANNVSIDALAVKGGDGYRLYENLGSSGSGFRSPDNNGGNIPEISHYSFNITIDIPEEPWIGKIRVIKTVIDPNNIQSPEGISFTLIGPNGYEETKETDDEGIIEFTELEEGQYTLTEDIPDGYLSSIGNGKTIILPDDADEDYIAEIEVENRKIPDESDPKGKITIKKLVIDSEDNIIEDGTEFEFEIYVLNESEEWILLDTVTIVGNSSVTLNDLSPGEYMIKEVHIPDGYTLTSDNNLEVSILEDVESNVNFTNQKDNETPPPWKGTLVIQKIIESHYPEIPTAGTPTLSGFEFELWNEDGKVSGPLATGEDGKVSFDNLPAGDYEIREINSQGYIPKGPFYFTLDPEFTDDGIYYHQFYNEPVPAEDIVVQKIVIDEGNENPDLGGFTFRLYRLIEDEDGSIEEFIRQITTEEDGLAIFNDLEFGIYMLYEDPIEGYEMGLGTYGSGKGLQIIHSQEYTGLIKITNIKIPQWKGTIEVIKNVVDTRNATPGLSGFTFRLYKTSESIEEFVSEQTTGSMGIVFFSGLGEGVYKLYELDRAGYIKGISNSGLSLVLNRETTNEDRLLKVNITNIADYPDEEDPETPEEDDDDDNPPLDEDDDTTPPDEEETIEEEIPEAIPETPEEEVIIEEEIPEAAPEIKIESEEILPEEEIEIVESVPLAAPSLPATGTTSEYMFYGFGGLLLAIGQFIRRKK
ncbi:SpaA isopeptide-forming pilin-related protein [Tissierella carlieri]|uniref:SpaA isopeptide-forming pilin-related protein n=1 Tax=Tissierella carlieri TaxID=689904 RepID=A0ABT1S9E8_9FIRM|nr:SpaA isopeptide-forming pilin-related protein [Tissierella carlieri]MCQ4923095.1 SpaA isopeptide-forming pilin-related protein [Tissierella carlieri]